MKAVIINKSDRTGGAAVVSFRLMQALRGAGIDARMVVAEKIEDSPYVMRGASPTALKRTFLAERLKIFLANGMNRDTLFKIDTASDGIDLSRHPWVREADVICLNWINQGLLSLKGIDRLLRLGKPVVWTMHDMWCFTGVCHHAGECRRFVEGCRHCPLLGNKVSDTDISRKTHMRKRWLYDSPSGRIHFVAVSNWLADLARQSSLLGDQSLSVIPNAFPIDDTAPSIPQKTDDGITRIVFGAARLDDNVKGFPILIEATRALKRNYPELASRSELVTFGNIRDASLLDMIDIPHRHLGMLHGEKAVADVYDSGDIVVSTSLYETLPGTLVEGQAHGCVPVSFARGGQRDIVEHLSTGYLAEWHDDPTKGGEEIARGIAWAAQQGDETRERMRGSVVARFSARAIADAYISLFETLLEQR